jgi:CRISPR-associated endonuclease/helicase Cas3
VDFPLVLREMAPLEAIIQSAGRCNREGLLNAADGTLGGRFIVFRSRDGRIPKDRWYQAGRDLVEMLARAKGRWPDIHDPADMRDYFQRLYHTGELDKHKIQDLRKALDFPTVAESYRLIEDDTFAVVVTTWERHQKRVQRLLARLRQNASRQNFRRLAPFQVNLRHYEMAKASGQIAEGPSGMQLWIGPYDDSFGLRLDGNLGDCVV